MTVLNHTVLKSGWLSSPIFLREKVSFNSCSALSCLFWYVNFLLVDSDDSKLIFGLSASVTRPQFVFLIFLRFFKSVSFLKHLVEV